MLKKFTVSTEGKDGSIMRHCFVGDAEADRFYEIAQDADIVTVENVRDFLRDLKLRELNERVFFMACTSDYLKGFGAVEVPFA